MKRRTFVQVILAGSLDMEGHRNDPYDVLLVGESGKYSVYRHYNGK